MREGEGGRGGQELQQVCAGGGGGQPLTPSLELTAAPWSQSSWMLAEQSDMAVERAARGGYTESSLGRPQAQPWVYLLHQNPHN